MLFFLGLPLISPAYIQLLSSQFSHISIGISTVLSSRNIDMPIVPNCDTGERIVESTVVRVARPLNIRPDCTSSRCLKRMLYAFQPHTPRLIGFEGRRRLGWWCWLCYYEAFILAHTKLLPRWLRGRVIEVLVTDLCCRSQSQVCKNKCSAGSWETTVWNCTD